MRQGGPVRLRRRRRSRRFGNLGYRLPQPVRLLFQGQVGLGYDADYAVIPIHHRYSPYLMLLHQAFTLFNIFSIPAGESVLSYIVLNGSAFRIQSASNDVAAQITVGDYSDQLLRLMIAHYGNQAHILFAHNSRHCLCVVTGQATDRILAHGVLYLHDLPPLVVRHCWILMLSTMLRPAACAAATLSAF